MDRLEKRVGFHSHAHALRHTFATVACQAGWNLERLRAAMDTLTTQCCIATCASAASATSARSETGRISLLWTLALGWPVDLSKLFGDIPDERSPNPAVVYQVERRLAADNNCDLGPEAVSFRIASVVELRWRKAD